MKIQYTIYNILTKAWDEQARLYKIKGGFDSKEDAILWMNDNKQELTSFSEYTILPIYKVI